MLKMQRDLILNMLAKDGKEKFPLILHTSLSGAVERVLYAILEKSTKIMREGKNLNSHFG